ncbi:MAG: hypothetical protein WC058_07450 [Phycisphaeraceae bacterium]
MSESAMDMLRAMRAGHRTMARGVRLWRGAAVWLGMAAGVVVTDIGWSVLGAIGERDAFTVHELPGWVRLVMLVMLGIGAVTGAWRMARVEKRELTWYAREVERMAELRGNELVNAVGLAEEVRSAKPQAAPQAADALRAGLRQRVMRRADGVAAELDWAGMLDRTALRRARMQAGWMAGLWGVLIVCVWAMTGGGLTTELLRIADPLGDHPPLGAARLKLQDARNGDNVTLRLNVSGRQTDEARLRLEDGTTLPMRRNEDGSFETTLRSMNQPMRVRAEAANTWTAWMVVIPAKLNSGEATAGSREGRHEGVEASTSGAQGGEGDGGGGTSTPEPMDMTAAVGALLEQAGSPAETERLRRLVEQVPAEYREQVARYLLSISEDKR